MILAMEQTSIGPMRRYILLWRNPPINDDSKNDSYQTEMTEDKIIPVNAPAFTVLYRLLLSSFIEDFLQRQDIAAHWAY